MVPTAGKKSSQSCVLLLAGLSTLPVFWGCTLCCSPHDWDYAAVGSKHVRIDRQNGRLGSPFSDPNYATASSGTGSGTLTSNEEESFEEYVRFESDDSPSDLDPEPMEWR